MATLCGGWPCRKVGPTAPGLPIRMKITMADHQRGVSDEWFEQWPQTGAYVASDGHANRIPLRLTSTNVIVYGRAKLAEVLKDFEHEDHRPVTVGGDVPVQLWCNKFTDTDCGPADRVNSSYERRRQCRT